MAQRQKSSNRDQLCARVTVPTLSSPNPAPHAPRPHGRRFAARALAAARKAWAAALAHPARYADPDDGIGGGAYPDSDATDEFSWAAAELYPATGERQFERHVPTSPLHTADIFGPLGFDWARTAAAGRLDHATVPDRLPGRDTAARSARRTSTAAATPAGSTPTCRTRRGAVLVDDRGTRAGNEARERGHRD
ncbi:hypothetical protein GCM10010254_49100 [Streptomyces chromofuscus]|uniref:Glycoside hydrolase family 9 protein n=1 Tax=Streptomyces chromofuscus TaxID=42881 RepID=A0A7M2T6V2_STRCW|nr:glycoside hydrolase family 9 protein [Streptomyces chromofuscus]GGT22813.1 hypothetical protein GCM10010254_49100 [Streptomyces chromofuscus]